MPQSEVVVVQLRQPRRADASEKRSDPFWEFGSFGITGCHCFNLMRPDRAKLHLEGTRLAFAQGGQGEMRLVFLTPPIKRVVEYADRSEALWEPSMPFKFCKAPLLIDNDRRSDFPLFMRTVTGKGKTWVQRFSSKFRSRTTPLTTDLAKEIAMIFDAKYRVARRDDLAQSYEGALPYPPRLVDRQRDGTYEEKRD